MNRFRILDSFRVTNVGFVFAGEIVAGEVAPGMTFQIPEAGHKWTVQIKSVEFIRKSGGKEDVGLVVEDGDWLPGLGVGWIADVVHPDSTRGINEITN